ncbi:hypothetical protein GCM10009558_074030 [Virgisporangium aurantiacum]
MAVARARSSAAGAADDQPSATRAGTADDQLILAGDAASRQLIAFDPAVTDWNGTGAIRWTWKPTTGLGFSTAEVNGFNGGSDFKVRTSGRDGAQRLVVADGAGIATVATYPEGRRVWAKLLTGNLHSAELLPDDNIALAASDGGWVRVYASSQGADASAYGEYKLAAAHATLWDPSTSRLWVIGQDPVTAEHILTALAVVGTPAAPRLREDTTKRVVLPTPWGHDVTPYSYDTGKLWVTTNGGAYLYDKATKEFSSPGAANRVFVKAMSNQPSGQIVETMADSLKNPKGPCAAINGWCTDTVDLFGPDGKRTRKNAQFYKARVLNPYYGAVDQSRRGTVWDRTRAADGTWAASAVRIDANGDLVDVAAAALPNGTVHVLGLLPKSGIWHRERSAAGVWAASATKIDANVSITDVAAAALPNGTLNVFGVVPGSGVWHRDRSAAGVWAGSATQVDTNGAVSDLAAAGLADGTLQLFCMVPTSGLWHKERNAAKTWAGATKIDTNGETSVVAAAGWPGTALQVTMVAPGSGVYSRVRAADRTWPAAQRIDAEPDVLELYAVGRPDGVIHVGKVPELS